MPVAYTEKSRRPIAPNDYERCYACDARPVGVAERWKGGMLTLEHACRRHANPTIVVQFVHACSYCGTEVRNGSVGFGDGTYAHRSCAAADERANN